MMSVNTEIYTLSLHDALPILSTCQNWGQTHVIEFRSSFRTLTPRIRCTQEWLGSSATTRCGSCLERRIGTCQDRKSTRLNSSHCPISYAVFCLKKKKETEPII